MRELTWTTKDGHSPYFTFLGLSLGKEYIQSDRFSLGWSAGLLFGLTVYEWLGGLSLYASGLDDDDNNVKDCDENFLLFDFAVNIYYSLWSKHLILKYRAGFTAGWLFVPDENPDIDTVSSGSGILGGFTGLFLDIRLHEHIYLELGYQLYVLTKPKQIYMDPLPNPFLMHYLSISLRLRD